PRASHRHKYPCRITTHVSQLEPSEAVAAWPIGPASSLQDRQFLAYHVSESSPCRTRTGEVTYISHWSRREDLNTPYADYDSTALPLSYTGSSTPSVYIISFA